jgi:hypothetical protein
MAIFGGSNKCLTDLDDEGVETSLDIISFIMSLNQ